MSVMRKISECEKCFKDKAEYIYSEFFGGTILLCKKCAKEKSIKTFGELRN